MHFFETVGIALGLGAALFGVFDGFLGFDDGQRLAGLVEDDVIGEAYGTNALVPVATESIGLRMEFEKRIRARLSFLSRSAMDSIDAAVALLALGQVSQSFLLFSQAAEVSLKAILDEVKRMGLAAWGAASPAFMRKLAAMNSVSLPGTVKDSTFLAAFRDVAEFVDFSDEVRSAVHRINSARNEIAHRGGEREQVPFYLDLLLNSVLPLLDEPYRHALGLDVADFILHDIARELIVAAKFVAGRRHDSESWWMALRPLRAAHHHRWPTDQGIPLDFSSDNCVDNRHYEMRSDWERYFAKGVASVVSSRPTASSGAMGLPSTLILSRWRAPTVTYASPKVIRISLRFITVRSTSRSLAPNNGRGC